MALTQIDQTFELREVSLKNRPKELYNISSKGTIPVLLNTDGRIIDESLDIMKWSMINDSFINKFDNQLSIIKLIDNDFKFWLDKYKYYNRFPDNSQEYYRKKASLHLIEIDNILNDKYFIMADNLQLVDIAVFPIIRQFINVDQIWFKESFKNIYSWYKKISTSLIYTSVMTKYDFWEEGNEPLLVNFFQTDNIEKLMLQIP